MKNRYESANLPLAEYLAYDSEKGILTWRKPPARRIKPGTEAGAVSNGEIYVRFRGHRILAIRLIWFLVLGEWPAHRVITRNGDRTDLRLVNIRAYQSSPTYSAQMQRNRRVRLQQSRRLAQFIQDSSESLREYIRPVFRDHDIVYWRAKLPVNGGNLVLPLGRFSTYENGLKAARLRRIGVEFLDANPPQTLHPIIAARRPDNPQAPTLAEFNRHFAYDPINGKIYRRGLDRLYDLGRDAVTAGPGQTRLVIFNKRNYSAHLVAWFLYHHEWPKPRTLKFRNRQRDDLRLANLYLATNESPAG